jgi:hypothetical protein
MRLALAIGGLRQTKARIIADAAAAGAAAADAEIAEAVAAESALAATAALLGRRRETLRELILEFDALAFQGVQARFGQQFAALFDAADALIQLFVLQSQSGEIGVALTQFVQGIAQFGEILDQGVVFDVHGGAPESECIEPKRPVERAP